MATSKKPTVSDPKKRAFEALERRFAAAKADLHQQQQKNKKRTHGEEEEAPNKHSSSISSPKPNISSPMPSSNKGHFASQDRISSQKASGVADVEASSPAYFLLSQPVHDNLLMTGTELSRRRGSIGDKMVHELLQKGDSAQKYMQGSRGMKIDNWLLLDSFVQGRGASMGACLRSINSRSKRSKRHMSMQQHRKCGSLDLPHEFHNFNLFKPMHEMWKDYTIQLLKNNGKGQLAQCLLNADLHGAILQVVPKKGSVFIFQAGCWKITLHGDKLSLRNAGP
ncbi:ribonuclease MRP protein subunit POP4 isoform X2 [Magnolia sinica]|uniref:ribonuclease MRP protein subunit POP4 isoform X2 n=1 Tax=Magnolia sinica TaxID=86752 RepID=UPI00265A373D|nr:ribonuclease MRP protein subunit POP4 isoform X2 [Magnolia sinica]XP_058078412.1 ribonuclease MRP protein subunit POP4 isoform X2 [Magnolia sinica]